jgi:hypothetical protein
MPAKGKTSRQQVAHLLNKVGQLACLCSGPLAVSHGRRSLISAAIAS